MAIYCSDGFIKVGSCPEDAKTLTVPQDGHTRSSVLVWGLDRDTDILQPLNVDANGDLAVSLCGSIVVGDVTVTCNAAGIATETTLQCVAASLGGGATETTLQCIDSNLAAVTAAVTAFDTLYSSSNCCTLTTADYDHTFCVSNALWKLQSILIHSDTPLSETLTISLNSISDGWETIVCSANLSCAADVVYFPDLDDGWKLSCNDQIRIQTTNTACAACGATIKVAMRYEA